MSKNTFSVPLTKHQFIGGYLYLAAEFLVIPTLLRYLIDIFFQGASDATVNFLYYLINFCAVWLIFRGFLTRNLGILRNHFLMDLHVLLLKINMVENNMALLIKMERKPFRVNINMRAIFMKGYVMLKALAFFVVI